MSIYSKDINLSQHHCGRVNNIQMIDGSKFFTTTIKVFFLNVYTEAYTLCFKTCVVYP